MPNAGRTAEQFTKLSGTEITDYFRRYICRCRAGLLGRKNAQMLRHAVVNGVSDFLFRLGGHTFLHVVGNMLADILSQVVRSGPFATLDFRSRLSAPGLALRRICRPSTGASASWLCALTGRRFVKVKYLNGLLLALLATHLFQKHVDLVLEPPVGRMRRRTHGTFWAWASLHRRLLLRVLAFDFVHQPSHKREKNYDDWDQLAKFKSRKNDTL